MWVVLCQENMYYQGEPTSTLKGILMHTLEFGFPMNKNGGKIEGKLCVKIENLI